MPGRRRFWLLTLAALVLLPWAWVALRDSPVLEPWHERHLKEEFRADMLGEEVVTFDDYVALENRLFAELDETVIADVPTGPDQELNRFSRGSPANPAAWPRNWNRTVEWPAGNPRGGVLLLHGMSDSPYSLRQMGERLAAKGYYVIAPRLPGHGTIPAGLVRVHWQDMAAAVRLAARRLESRIGSTPLHIVGYSTGAPLALDYSLDALESDDRRLPDSLVLVSPAIRVHATGALAKFKDALSFLPGLDRMAYLSIMAEFDPFKYNSFATNAAAQVHALTTAVTTRVSELASRSADAARFPPILVFKSTVDSTVTTEAVVDDLLRKLPPGGSELVLFDLNRNASVTSTLLVSDPGPLTHRLLRDDDSPFAVTFVSNSDVDGHEVGVRRKPPMSAILSSYRPLELAWPSGVVSLSHVALPFPPDDPLYGRTPPDEGGRVYLGDGAVRGERGLIRISAEWLMRMRYNPFYGFLEERLFEWLETPR